MITRAMLQEITFFETIVFTLVISSSLDYTAVIETGMNCN